MNRSPRGLSGMLVAAALAACAGSAVGQSNQPASGRPVPGLQPHPVPVPMQPAAVQPGRPITPAATPAPSHGPAPQGTPAAQPAPTTPAQGQPAGAPAPNPGAGQPGVPVLLPGTVPNQGGGATPQIRPMNIFGQQAATPFWWGPTFGRYRVHDRGPIPGAYTPMGRPAVLRQPPYYPAPGQPERFQDELSYGPLPSPGPGLPNDDLGPIRPITDPHPTRPPQVDPGDFGRDVFVTLGDGIVIRGRVEGDRFKLAFTVGGQPFLVDRFGLARDIGRSYFFDDRFNRFHGGYPVFYGSAYGTRYYSPVYGQLATIDPAYVDPMLMPGGGAGSGAPAGPPAIDESLLADVERAHLMLERGRAAEAIEFYSAHLADHPDDAHAMRWLAVALLARPDVPAGVAMMIMAYETEPTLAGAPLSEARFPRGGRGLEARFVAASQYANSLKSSSAYLTAAVLAQAAGKQPAAVRLLAKAKAAGLDRAVWREMDAALKR